MILINRNTLTLLLLLLCFSACGQKKKEIKVLAVDDTAKKNIVMPTYPGDIGEFLFKNVKFTKQVKGDEEVRFLIDTAGALSQFKIVKSLSAEIDSAVVRALRVMPPWNPATENGTPVSMWYNLPIDMN
ncbi:MAG: Gram-negative bacterial tonB protein [Flavipsychrobacter sp.]|nr:Gram-negative bacterial tonB protein [Flavipsychrobacter sp.]